MQLHQFPNYENALPIEERHGTELDPKTFKSDYVKLSKPLVVRGAAKHWSAHQWDLATLRDKLRDVPNIFSHAQGLITKPMREYAGTYVGEERALASRKGPNMTAHAFLDMLEQGEEAAAYAVSLKTPGIQPLLEDIGDLSFINADVEQQGFLYGHRLFLYRGGFTDWHFHYADDGVTIQVMGRKEFLFLPNNKKAFKPLWKFSRHRGSWELTDEDIENLAELQPYKVVLEPGDALFIPVFWWHAVEPCDKEIGATLALVQKAPAHIQFDPRLPGARWNMRQCLTRKGFRRFFPVFVMAGCWPLCRFPFHPPYLERS